MLDSHTKRRIDDCRDILVGKLPDPKAQIEQITIGLIYKFMNDMDNEAIELGGQAKFFADYRIPNPEYPNDRDKDKLVEFNKYAWSNLVNPKITAAGMLILYSEAILGMDKNPNIPQLFRDIFKNAFLPYNDPETLKMFLKTIGEFEYTHSEKLGDAFEYLLSVMGSQGDAGQFRTPRHIIDFLVANVNPGKTDTILDPACGTAGFLISAFKHIKEQNNNELTPDERRKLIQNFVGYDISPDMVRLSLVNLYLHGFSDPHIYEYDTLSSEERWNENYDVILANPPFMSPKGGIRPHKKFSISSNRSEVLFVDYIAEHLNPKGRAGIIVPEGVIFQSGTAYKELRKMLIENYLYAVVSLPAGVFNPYSGVKTSILLMDKEIAKQRSEILFLKIDNDGFNLGAQRAAIKGSQLQEATEIISAFRQSDFVSQFNIAHTVSKSEIAKKGDYNLNGDGYKQQNQLSTEYPLIDFENAIEKITYTSKIKSSDYKDSGYFPIIDQSDNYIAGYWDKPEDVFKIVKPVIIFGDHTRCFKYVDFDFVLGADGVKILQPIDKYNSKFFYYMIREIRIKNLGYSRHYKELKDKKIPLPPLSVQNEIVAEIDGYQKIINGAQAVVAAYKPKIDIEADWETKKLGEISDFKNGLNYSKDSKGEVIKILGVSHFKNSLIAPVAELDELQVDEVGENFLLRKGDIVFVRSNGNKDLVGRSLIIPEINERISFSGFTIRCRLHSGIEPLYIGYLFKSDFHSRMMKGVGRGANIRNLSQDILNDILIPVPSLEIQHKIIDQLGKEQELVNANKQLIEIFEQKIKNRMAKVWGV